MVTKVGSEQVHSYRRCSTRDTRSFLRQEENLDYVQKHYNELRKKYGNKWIVVSHRGVIASEDDPRKLIAQLAKMKEKDTFLYFMSDPEELMIL